MLSERKGISEKKAFGSTCFLLNGNVCVGDWKGSLAVRLDKEQHDETLAEPHTKPFGMPGRVMKGWAVIEPAGIESDGDLRGVGRESHRFCRVTSGQVIRTDYSAVR